ncbi:Utp5p [Sporobolomyces koalae]|uniref:Utp5p n=1 Tax=Sporobolomyces koalae TaxID=500713 RepID=UPI0031783102
MGKKTPKSTPRTTAINPASIASVLTSFSPSTSSASPYYAHLHCAPDAHTLRVYEVESGKCVSRWASNGAGQDGAANDEEPRVRSMQWCWLPVTSNASATDDSNLVNGTAESKRGKKRRKSDGGSAQVDSPVKPASSSSVEPKLAIALGLENGSVLLWDPRGVAQARTLHHATSTSPVTALASPVSASYAQDGHLWSAHEDGAVRLWDLASANLVGKVNGLTEEKRWDDLLVRYESSSQAQIVLSHLSLHVYTVQLAGSAPAKKDKLRELKATEIGRCTGHVEPARIRWTGAASSTVASEVDTLSFLSFTSSDRFVQIWSIPAKSSSSPANGALVARLALDSGVSSASLSPLSFSSSTASDSQTLAAIDTITGSVSLTNLPLVFPSASPAKKGKKNASTVVALEVSTEISSSAQSSAAGVAEVAFREGLEGSAIVCRGGVKPVFEVVAFRDEDGIAIKKVELSRSANGSLLVGAAADASSSVPQPARYSEHSTSAVAATSGVPDAAAVDSDAEEEAINAGELDVDMAEPTLADRLKALNVSQKKERRKAALAAKKASVGADDVEVASESSGSEDVEDSDEDEDDDEVSSVPATTLTTTLVQALHSSDAPLLESCLTHSNPVLVRSTVKRLPSGSLVLGLLEALVERLGKEKRGKEGMASVKRARALVVWLRETLIVHVGFLVTIPSLVNRLASLHASLTQRLALQPALLALNGRLELVMSQIDMRQDRPTASAQLPANGGKRTSSKAKRYVEGESDDEDDGEIEDVVLGPRGGDEFDDDEDEDEDDDEDVDSAFEDEEDGAGSAKPRRKVNGVSSLLDLEASEDEEFDDDEVDEEDFEGIDEDDLEEDGDESD